MTDKWVVCLKHGDKYGSMYVNKLFNMVSRHMTEPFRFACITENPYGLNKDITVLNLPMLGNTRGWWFKPYLFSKNFPLTGTILYLDLDLVIVNNIDKFWTYEPGKNLILQNFHAPKHHDLCEFNSSVIRYTSQGVPHLWNNFVSNSRTIKEKYHGDQDYIYAEGAKFFTTFPTEWAQSYKWQVRSKEDLEVYNNKLRFKSTANPNVSNETSILVFHGDPKPHEIDDSIVVENWR
jgi:hypothetical protein